MASMASSISCSSGGESFGVAVDLSVGRMTRRSVQLDPLDLDLGGGVHVGVTLIIFRLTLSESVSS
jgi:hypothetical protein